VAPDVPAGMEASGVTGMEGRARPAAVAPPEEDPNATVVCASPPCLLHELDPSWLGYLRRDEVAALLGELLAAEWSGTVLETAWLRAMLRRHLARLGGVSPLEPRRRDIGARAADGPWAGPAAAGWDRLARGLREALPRLHDDALQRDLADLLLIMERDMRRRRERAGRN
jgi:hypothetical protein